MKKIILGTFFCWASVMLVHAQNDEVSYSKENNTFTLKVKSRANALSLTVKGEVTLGDDDKSITQLSRAGSIIYRKEKESLEIEHDGQGNLVYTINGYKKTTLNENDKALIEDCVQLMISYGIDADNRVKRIFAQKGTPGVLHEVERFKSDYVKEIYLSYLLNGQKLLKDEMIALLNKINQYLSSDYYKAQLLDGVMASFIADEATSGAYLNVVNNITSDYYQSTTLQKILGTALNEKQFTQVLGIVSSMKSDYYQAKVLEMLLNNNNIADARFSAIMKVVATMKSDYYKAELSSTLLKNKSLNKDQFAQTMIGVQNMKSSYYQYTMLAGLIDENMKDEAAWSSLILYAGKIDSDYYQAEMLKKIAGTMPASETLSKELTAAAKNIKSDYYYGKVMRSMDTRE